MASQHSHVSSKSTRLAFRQACRGTIWSSCSVRGKSGLSGTRVYRAHFQHGSRAAATASNSNNVTITIFRPSDIVTYLPKPVYQMLEKKTGGVLVNLNKSWLQLSELRNPQVVRRIGEDMYEITVRNFHDRHGENTFVIASFIKSFTIDTVKWRQELYPSYPRRVGWNRIDWQSTPWYRPKIRERCCIIPTAVDMSSSFSFRVVVSTTPLIPSIFGASIVCDSFPRLRKMLPQLCGTCVCDAIMKSRLARTGSNERNKQQIRTRMQHQPTKDEKGSATTNGTLILIQLQRCFCSRSMHSTCINDS